MVNRHQQQTTENLVEENCVLKDHPKARRVWLTDDQRRRLAAKGQRFGRRVQKHVATIVTPETILRWHWGPDRPEVDVRAEAARASRNHDGGLVAQEFGSLDPNETLGIVAEALQALQADDRMVGIVTHLPQLADEMPAQIRVVKTQTGSHVEVTTE